MRDFDGDPKKLPELNEMFDGKNVTQFKTTLKKVKLNKRMERIKNG